MTRWISLLALAAIISTSSGSSGWAAGDAPSSVCEREMTRAAKSHGVPVGVLYAVGLTETGRRGSLQPFAMNVEGRAQYAGTAAEAVRAVESARKDGAVLIDVGCMQINHHYHRDAFASLAEMFEPRKNVDYAAVFLKRLKQREGNWTMAVARYHAGPDNDPAQKRYVCSVITNMVATGFGAWTADARAFCE